MEWLREGCGSLKVVDFENLNREQGQEVRRRLLEIQRAPQGSAEFIEACNVDGVDIFEAALSTLIGRYRNPTLTAEYNPDNFKELIRVGLISYYSFQNHVQENTPKLCYIFNGRIVRYRPALRVCQRMGMPVYTYEYPLEGFKRYALIKDVYPHDLPEVSKQLLEAYAKSRLSEKRKFALARTWYEKRIARSTQSNLIQPVAEQSGVSGFTVLITTSTEYEYAGLVEGRIGYFYRNQLDALEQILSTLAGEVTFTIRIHPYSANDEWFIAEKIMSLQGSHPGVNVISPRSDADTYLLMAGADLVLTFGSTTGAEAAFMRKPVIVVGAGFYKAFALAAHPDSHEQLVALVRQAKTGDFSGFPSEHQRYVGALRYGFAFAFTARKAKFVKRSSYLGGGMVRRGLYTEIRANRALAAIVRLTSLPTRILQYLRAAGSKR
jgi:hypothetical protein